MTTYPLHSHLQYVCPTYVSLAQYPCQKNTNTSAQYTGYNSCPFPNAFQKPSQMRGPHNLTSGYEEPHLEKSRRFPPPPMKIPRNFFSTNPWTHAASTPGIATKKLKETPPTWLQRCTYQGLGEIKQGTEVCPVGCCGSTAWMLEPNSMPSVQRAVCDRGGLGGQRFR